MKNIGQRSLRDAAREGCCKRPSIPDVPPVPRPAPVSTASPTSPPAKKAAPACEKCLKRAESDRQQHEAQKQAKECRKARAESRRQAIDARFNRLPGGRLPNCAKYVDLLYDAATMCWTGSLVIPGDPPKVFILSRSSLHKLTDDLCAMYCDTLESKETTA